MVYNISNLFYYTIYNIILSFLNKDKYIFLTPPIFERILKKLRNVLREL